MKVLADPDGIVTGELTVQSLPTHILIDGRGMVTGVERGVREKSALQGALF